MNIRSHNVKAYKSIKLWTDALIGQPAFLLGNGPSLSDQNLSLIKDRFTIGINRAFYRLDPTVLMWQDQSLWETEKHRVVALNALKVVRDSVDLRRRFFRFQLNPGGFQLATSPHVLYGKGSSGPLAFQLAYAMGCNPIVLLGYDCQHRGKKTDFYGVNKFHKSTTMGNCVRGLKWISELKQDRTIINCSDNQVFGKTHKLKDIVDTLGEAPGGVALRAKLKSIVS